MGDLVSCLRGLSESCIVCSKGGDALYTRMKGGSPIHKGRIAKSFISRRGKREASTSQWSEGKTSIVARPLSRRGRGNRNAVKPNEAIFSEEDGRERIPDQRKGGVHAFAGEMKREGERRGISSYHLRATYPEKGGEKSE